MLGQNCLHKELTFSLFKSVFLNIFFLKNLKISSCIMFISTCFSFWSFSLLQRKWLNKLQTLSLIHLPLYLDCHKALRIAFIHGWMGISKGFGISGKFPPGTSTTWPSSLESIETFMSSSVVEPLSSSDLFKTKWESLSWSLSVIWNWVVLNHKSLL